MTAFQFISRHAGAANILAKTHRIPSLALITLAAWQSAWGNSAVNWHNVIRTIQQSANFYRAKAYVNNNEQYCNILFRSNDKDSYTLKSYVRIFKIALGHSVPILYADKIKDNREAFFNALVYYSNLLTIDPDWLMIVIKMECEFDFKAVNKYTGATGAIQFTPDTARYYGTSVNALLDMPNYRQMDFVYKYYKAKAGRIYSLYDLYKLTILPISYGKDANWTLKFGKVTAETFARQNNRYDINQDKAVTIAELETWIYNNYVKNLA